MKFTSALFLGALPVLARGASHDVHVGRDGLVITPAVLHAKNGDKVHFHFYPGAHAVARSPFDKPCKPSAKHGIFSGFFNPPMGVDDQMFTVTIQNQEPIWLYCPQGTHCQAGMSMVINPPKHGHTIKQYKAHSGHVSQAGVPGRVQGGKVGPNHGS